MDPLLCLCFCSLGLLYAGDKLVEVNGVSVEGLDPEQVIHILVTAALGWLVTDLVTCQAPWCVCYNVVPLGSFLSSALDLVCCRVAHQTSCLTPKSPGKGWDSSLHKLLPLRLSRPLTHTHTQKSPITCARWETEPGLSEVSEAVCS